MLCYFRACKTLDLERVPHHSSEAFVSLPMPLGHKGCSLMTRGEARESPARKTREMMSLDSLGSLLACGVMIEATGGPCDPGGFGESWPDPPGSLGEFVRGKEWFDLVALLFAVLVSLPIA